MQINLLLLSAFFVLLASPKILRLGKMQINLLLLSAFFRSLASPKILRLGKMQINLLLPSAFRIFCAAYEQRIELWCNGNTADFGSVVLGSSPGSSTYSTLNISVLFCFVRRRASALPEVRPRRVGISERWSVAVAGLYERPGSVACNAQRSPDFCSASSAAGAEPLKGGFT